MLLTMPDLKWTVRVDTWTWVYTFSHLGTVSWKDPNNGMGGNGTWRIVGDQMIISWFASTTEDRWDVPFNPNGTDGTSTMGGKEYPLKAVATNYYYEPGDVVYGVGVKLVRAGGLVASIIYPDEVRSGGTVAWICRNPGNIKSWHGADYGAYPGKQLNISATVGPFAIFPTEDKGFDAIVTVLKGYGKVSIHQLMQGYAPKKDGNDPDAYAAQVARDLGVKDTAILQTDVDLGALARAMTKVEFSRAGTTWTRDAADLPEPIRSRLARPLYPPTDEELRNSSLGVPLR
jgi:hypothetical protein